MTDFNESRTESRTKGFQDVFPNTFRTKTQKNPGLAKQIPGS